MSYHSNNTLSLQQVGDSNNEHVYFSRITQQWEPVWFYATMLKKLGSFAQAIDRCSPTSRELVWSHIFSLYNQPNRKCTDLFGPIIDEWCHSQAIDLSAIEIMYTSFLQIYNQYPGLFEDMLTPAPSSLSTGEREHSLSYSGGLFSDGKMVEFKKEEPKPKPIKLSNTSLIWGSSFTSSIQQFSLLLNWAPLLEKLPPNQKEAIWNTCQFFPLFTESFDRSSFRKTFLKWASNIYAHLSHITILFASIGFLRDKGIIKHQFFYPNTTVPVFNNGAKTQPPPASPYYPPPTHPLFTPPSPLSSPSSSPSLTSHSSSPSVTSRSPSPATSGSDFQAQALHHFYPHASSPSHPHPVLPTLDGMRAAKSLPFDSLSLPPLSLPSAPLPTPAPTSAPATAPAPGTSSSRLGLLALAAFQVDDTAEVAQQPGAGVFPTLAPRQNQTPKENQDAPTATPTKSVPASLSKVEEVNPDARPPTLKLPASSPTPSNSTVERPATTPTEQKEVVTSAPATTLPKKEPAAMMKIGKRKNSSCSDYHDDEAKRPRPMNLSHILCS
eukprot:Phypoly_transcript_06424.p1 GENE.Phypoly_transcript_06424~~Phypoly_transcript_06424.p1  ORF type:complete len:596 (-),score=154.56 Phypoly_transcript_06424:7-1662(-)